MIDREQLENEALKAVCACRYYDLADYMSITTTEELLAIIEHRSMCDNCHLF
jgi:hypothetical protein